MSKIHRDNDYQQQSQLLFSKFWGWSTSKTAIKTSFEIEKLQELSLEAYKLAKLLENKIAPPKSNNLNLFDDSCSLNKHSVKVWQTTGYAIKDRAPIMRGECTKCLAEVVNYGN